jgi:hypothetical protein
MEVKEDDNEEDDNDYQQSSSNNNNNNQSNNGGNITAASRAGEVTGMALRKTGKHLSAFGENMLKHLLAEDDDPRRRAEVGTRERERERQRKPFLLFSIEKKKKLSLFFSPLTIHSSSNNHQNDTYL